MLSENFRPWGNFLWVKNKIQVKEWCFIGCLGNEDRFITAVESAEKYFELKNTLFIQVVNFDKSNEIQEITNKNKNNLLSMLKLKPTTKTMELFESAVEIKKEIDRFIKESNGNILLDISCFPKRFFFQILKVLWQYEEINNILICHTLAESYPDEPLSEDFQSIDYLPMFQSKEMEPSTKEKAIISVGFSVIGLSQLLKNHGYDDVTLLFPFPPGPPNYQRTWNFVREMEVDYNALDHEKIIRVDIKDVSGCYDNLLNATDNGMEGSVLFPYGPKTHSLAMALFAINFGCGVFYGQPRKYNPNYSLGVKKIDGISETYLYCIKLNGKKFY